MIHAVAASAAGAACSPHGVRSLFWSISCTCGHTEWADSSEAVSRAAEKMRHHIQDGNGSYVR